MQAVTTIGLDIAKSVFQVHGICAEGNVIKSGTDHCDRSSAGYLSSGLAWSPLRILVSNALAMTRTRFITV